MRVQWKYVPGKCQVSVVAIQQGQWLMALEGGPMMVSILLRLSDG